MPRPPGACERRGLCLFALHYLAVGLCAAGMEEWVSPTGREGGARVARGPEAPPYLRNDGHTSEIFGPPWFNEYGVQQTRGFRALKIRMSLKHHGLTGYAEAIERDIALAEHLAHLVDTNEDLQRSGQAFISGTTLDGTFALRACIINPRTRPEDLERLVSLLQDRGMQLSRGGA